MDTILQAGLVWLFAQVMRLGFVGPQEDWIEGLDRKEGEPAGLGACSVRARARQDLGRRSRNREAL
jgi:hypothetical protein